MSSYKHCFPRCDFEIPPPTPYFSFAYVRVCVLKMSLKHGRGVTARTFSGRDPNREVQTQHQQQKTRNQRPEANRTNIPHSTAHKEHRDVFDTQIKAKNILNQRREVSPPSLCSCGWAWHLGNLLIIDYCFVRSLLRRRFVVRRLSLSLVCCCKLKMQIAQMIAPPDSRSAFPTLIFRFPHDCSVFVVFSCPLMFRWRLPLGKANFHKFLKQTHELPGQKS